MNSGIRHLRPACLQPIGAWHPDGNAARIAVTSNGTGRVARPLSSRRRCSEPPARESLVAPSLRIQETESAAHETGCLRSEENTTELQSLRHLVCRLLLEKKK